MSFSMGQARQVLPAHWHSTFLHSITRGLADRLYGSALNRSIGVWRRTNRNPCKPTYRTSPHARRSSPARN